MQILKIINCNSSFVPKPLKQLPSKYRDKVLFLSRQVLGTHRHSSARLVTCASAKTVIVITRRNAIFNFMVCYRSNLYHYVSQMLFNWVLGIRWRCVAISWSSRRLRLRTGFSCCLMRSKLVNKCVFVFIFFVLWVENIVTLRSSNLILY